MKLTVSGVSRKTTVSKGVDSASGNAMTRRVLLWKSVVAWSKQSMSTTRYAL